MGLSAPEMKRYHHRNHLDSFLNRSHHRLTKCVCLQMARTSHIFSLLHLHCNCLLQTAWLESMLKERRCNVLPDVCM